MSINSVKPKYKNAPLSPYSFFENERRTILTAVNYNNSAAQISKKLLKIWEELSPNQKSVYEDYHSILEYYQTAKYKQPQKILSEQKIEEPNKKSKTNAQTNQINEIKELDFGKIGGSLKLENGSKVRCDRPLFSKEENAFSLNCYQYGCGYGIVSCSFQISYVANERSKMTIGIIPLHSIPKKCTQKGHGYRLGFSEKNIPNSIGYWHSGHVYYESKKLIDFGVQFKMNDIIKVEMDFNKMRLFLYHNGAQQGRKKKNNLKLLKDTLYYFGVSLGHTGQEVTIIQ